MDTQRIDIILSENETKRLHKLADRITPPNWHIQIYNEGYKAGELQHSKGNLNIFIDLTNYPESKASDNNAVGLTKELSIQNGIGYCSIEIDVLAHKLIFETRSRKQLFETIEDTIIHEIAHVAEYQYIAYQNRFYREGLAWVKGGMMVSPDNICTTYDREMHGDTFFSAYLTLLNRGLNKYPHSQKMFKKYIVQRQICKDWKREKVDSKTD